MKGVSTMTTIKVSELHKGKHAEEAGHAASVGRWKVIHSAHPRHILRNIPYNLLYRIKRLVSDADNPKKRYNKLSKCLINQF